MYSVSHTSDVHMAGMLIILHILEKQA